MHSSRTYRHTIFVSSREDKLTASRELSATSTSVLNLIRPFYKCAHVSVCAAAVQFVCLGIHSNRLNSQTQFH